MKFIPDLMFGHVDKKGFAVKGGLDETSIMRVFLFDKTLWIYQ